MILRFVYSFQRDTKHPPVFWCYFSSEIRIVNREKNLSWVYNPVLAMNKKEAHTHAHTSLLTSTRMHAHRHLWHVCSNIFHKKIK